MALVRFPLAEPPMSLEVLTWSVPSLGSCLHSTGLAARVAVVLPARILAEAPGLLTLAPVFHAELTVTSSSNSTSFEQTHLESLRDAPFCWRSLHEEFVKTEGARSL